MDQVRPGKIDVEEIALGPIPSRQQPSRLDPCLQHLGVEPRMRGKLVGVTAPEGVGTLTLPPSTASFSEIGSST